jgi:hypothetical protein
MRTPFSNPSIIDNGNEIGIVGCLEAMGNCNNGATFENCTK